MRLGLKAVVVTSRQHLPEALEEILDAIGVGMGKGKSVPKLLAWIETAKPSELKQAVLDGALAPSGWARFTDGKEYPGKLARILVNSEAEESLTDILNCYYHSNHKLSPEAFQIFTNKCLKSSGDSLFPQPDLFITTAYNGWSGFVKANKELAKKFIMKIPKDELENLDPKEWCFDALGIKL